MALRSLVLPSLMALLSVLGSEVNYLLFHALAELFSVVLAGVALVVATTSLQFTRNHFVVFIAVALGWCGGLDLLHTLAFKGMDLLPVDDPNPATQLWMAARGLQAIWDRLEEGERNVSYSAPLRRKDGQLIERGLNATQLVWIESMAAHRPYRPALGLGPALAEVEAGRGQHYDPMVVDAALRLFRDRGWTLPS